METKYNQQKPTAIDLFSGPGGLTTGLKLAGFSVIGAVELDSTAAETYHLNHPEVNLWNVDIKNLSSDEIMTTLNLQPGELDLLAGCPPCQGFSYMRTKNRRQPVDDPRNDLIKHFSKLIIALQPKTIMLENVPGLEHDHRLEEFCKILENNHYFFDKSILDVSKYGVPQRRKRLILLASRLSRVSFETATMPKETVRSTIGSLPPSGTSGDELHDIRIKFTDKVMEIIKLIPKDGGSRRNLGEEYQLPCHKNNDGFKDVYGRMKWDDVSPTITGGCNNPSKGRFLHPEENREITLREAALLQTFPPDYKFSLKNGKSKVALMIGNALPPKFIKYHAKTLLKNIQGVVSDEQ